MLVDIYVYHYQIKLYVIYFLDVYIMCGYYKKTEPKMNHDCLSLIPNDYEFYDSTKFKGKKKMIEAIFAKYYTLKQIHFLKFHINVANLIQNETDTSIDFTQKLRNKQILEDDKSKSNRR